MGIKSVLICDFCGKVIDNAERYIHDFEVEEGYIEHEGYYHQSCYINSMIKDLEGLGFEVLRPNLQIATNTQEGAGKSSFAEKIGNLSSLIPLVQKVLSETDKKDYEEKKQEALNKIKEDNNDIKREEKKQSVGRAKKR